MSYDEIILWVCIFVSAGAALYYGQPAGYREHYDHIVADKRAVSVVIFTLLALGCALRILTHG